jgi:hypothetical protein
MPSLVLEGNRADSEVTVTLDDLRALAKLALSSVEVDEDWYLSEYPDVRAGVENGELSSAAEHYQRTGFLEGRLPSKPVIDEGWYQRTYPDVASGVADGKISNATEHYIRSGYLEGRLPSEPTVDEDWYKAANPDVADGIASGELPDAKSHFISRGYLEGRAARPAAGTTAPGKKGFFLWRSPGNAR